MISERMYQRTALGLFFFIFGYLVIRAFVNEPLHDEIATFYFYMYHGDFMGDQMVVDANNHLLNSLLGRLFYLVFGDSFFVFRLPNLLAFPLYFYGVYQVSKWFESRFFSLICLVSIVTIPFITEYFAFARGYGMSMAFLVMGIYSVGRWIQNRSIGTLFGVYTWIFLAVLANLSLLNSYLLLWVFTLVNIGLNFRNLVRPKVQVLMAALGLLVVVPFVIYGFKLKQGGALYYGNLEGLWDLTGSSLVRYVLFSESTGWFYLISALIGALIIYWLFVLRKQGFVKLIQQPIVLPVYLLLGSLGMAEVLARLFEVNYPEDRVAMYLVPLFIWSIVHVLANVRGIKWFAWVFLFFPVVFVWKLNWHTSVTTPADRMTQAFYDQVKDEITPKSSIALYRMMAWNWPNHEADANQKASVGLLNCYNDPFTDIIITQEASITNPLLMTYYERFAEEPQATYVALRRKSPLLKEEILHVSVAPSQSNGEYLDILHLDSLNIQDSIIQVTFEGVIQSNDVHPKCQVILHAIGRSGDLDYQFYPIDLIYRKGKLDASAPLHFVFINPKSELKEIKLYLWNRRGSTLSINGGKCYIYTVKNQ